MQIAIIGAGNVGGALGKGWARAGHAVAYGVPDPSAAKHRAVAEAAGDAAAYARDPSELAELLETALTQPEWLAERRARSLARVARNRTVVG